MTGLLTCPGQNGRPPFNVVVGYVGYTWGVSVRLLQRLPPGVMPGQGRQVAKPLVIDSSWVLWADLYAAAGQAKLSRIQLQNYVASTGRATLVIPQTVTAMVPPGKVTDTTFPVHAMLGYTDGSSEDFTFGKLSFLPLDPSSAEVLP